MIDIITSISQLSKWEFNQLDKSIGAAGCYERIKQRETDGRWHSRYLRWVDERDLMAVIPVYSVRQREWPDTAYDPRGWGLPVQVDDSCTARDFLLAGGCTDRRTGLHVHEGTRSMNSMRKLLVEMARLAADNDSSLIFPYISNDAMLAWSEASENNIAWTTLSREAYIPYTPDLSWQANLNSHTRNILARDARLIAEAGVRSSICTWPEVEERACRLISEHNIRGGRVDHPEFVRMRMNEWQECADVEIIVFTGRAGDLYGILTALLWEDELEVGEIGLEGDRSPHRLALYLELVFHEPLAFARAHGIRKMRFGPNAETAKGGRGAMFEILYGGYMPARNAKALSA